MDALGTEGISTSRTSAATSRLTGSRLILARVVWLLLVVPSVGLFVASLPVYYAQMQRVCVGQTACNIAGSLDANGMHQLPALSLSVSGYAALLTVFMAIIATIWSGVGFVIFWRRSDEWFALLTAFFLVMFNATYPGFPISVLALAYPALNVPITILGALGLASLSMFLMLFPNGRLVSRWMMPFLLLSLFSTVSTALPSIGPFSSGNPPVWLSLLLNIIVFGAIIFSQIFRYRRLSAPVERQQTKWVVFGIVVALVGITLLPPIFNFFSPTYVSQPYSLSSVILGMVNYPVVLLVIPLSVGTAILRSRLYDIDVLINRALVYVSLTLLLALLYFGLVIGLASLVRLITGQTGQSPVVIVASTLAIAALFHPLRRRLQAIIDRRFYRRKYNAARTLAAFSATLRGEIDLQQLREHLVMVVEETMQPAHVSLWLRLPEQDRKQRAAMNAPPPASSE